MFNSCELRLFWPESCPSSVASWFHEGAIPAGGGGAERTDLYLVEAGQLELGLKKRGDRPGYPGGFEVKGLLHRFPAPFEPALIPFAPQLWCKWTSRALQLDRLPTIAISKKRRLRKWDLDDAAQVREVALDADEQPEDGGRRPDKGCQLELTEVTVQGERWWTLGFEAFGPQPQVEQNLRRLLGHLARRRGPDWGAAQAASYPEWLAGLGKGAGR